MQAGGGCGLSPQAWQLQRLQWIHDHDEARVLVRTETPEGGLQPSYQKRGARLIATVQVSHTADDQDAGAAASPVGLLIRAAQLRFCIGDIAFA